MSNLIIQAAQFADKAHAGQVRKWTGQPYITHPTRVASRVIMLPGVDEEVVCAAWMHDVLEDCPGFEIPAVFSPRCVEFVQELTNPSKVFPQLPREERKGIDRRHLARCSYWARAIKLIDRIDNLFDMLGAPPDFVVLYANESKQLANAIVRPDEELTTDLGAELLALADKRISRRYGL